MPVNFAILVKQTNQALKPVSYDNPKKYTNQVKTKQNKWKCNDGKPRMASFHNANHEICFEI